MSLKYSLILGTLLFATLIHRGAMVFYVVTTEYARDWLQYTSLCILACILILNPMLVIFSVFKYSETPHNRLCLHSLWLLPVLLFFSNLQLIMNPKIMQKTLACTGVPQMPEIGQIVIRYYYGNLIVVCLGELFSYVILIGDTIELAISSSILFEILTWSSVYLIIYIFFMCFCCGMNIIVPYVTEFVLSESLKERMILPRVYRLAEVESSLICPICMENLRQEEDLASMQNCAHCFHPRCLEQWLDRNEVCPVCRGV